MQELDQTQELIQMLKERLNEKDETIATLKATIKNLEATVKMLQENAVDLKATIANLLYGDYLIAPVAECERSGFMGTTIALGSDTFKTWDEIIEFFSRLGGQ